MNHFCLSVGALILLSLSRTKKSNVPNNAPPSKHDRNQIQTDNASSLSRAYLLDVIDEALSIDDCYGGFRETEPSERQRR